MISSRSYLSEFGRSILFAAATMSRSTAVAHSLARESAIGEFVVACVVNDAK